MNIYKNEANFMSLARNVVNFVVVFSTNEMISLQRDPMPPDRSSGDTEFRRPTTTVVREASFSDYHCSTLFYIFNGSCFLCQSSPLVVKI